MTQAQQPNGDYLALTAALAGLAVLTPEQYGAAQARIGGRMVALLVRAVRKFGIPLSDPARRRMAQRVLPELVQARAQSYALAVRSMEHSAAVADEALPPVAPIEPYDPAAFARALAVVTEPLEKAIAAEVAPSRSVVTILDRRTGMPIVPRDADNDPTSGRVVYRIGERAGAAAAKHAFAAGRAAVQSTADRSGREIGWARVTTSARPCGFCVMLASRGPVYESEKIALYRPDGETYHYHCRCRAELVYRGKPWSGEQQWRHAAALWRSATAGYGGVDALNALRRALAAQRRNAAAAV